MADLVVDDVGLVMLDGAELPGCYQEMRIRGAVLTDDIKVQGRSGKAKQPKGWEDQEIRLRLTLTDDEDDPVLNAVATIHRLFTSSDRAARPKVFRLVNQHAIARGIDRVVFKYLETRDRNRDDTVEAELVFAEFRPVIVKKEKRAAKARPETNWAENPYLSVGDDGSAEASDEQWTSVFDEVDQRSESFWNWHNPEPRKVRSYGPAHDAVEEFRGVFTRPSSQPRTVTPQSPVVDDDDPWSEVKDGGA